MKTPVFKEIYEATRFLRPFPAPEEVFVEPISKYAEHILPLVSVDLSVINSEWSGWIHFVLPIESCVGDGIVGECTKHYHNYNLRTNWIGFKIRDGRYELPGDFRYFLLENPTGWGRRVRESYKGQRAEIEQDYPKVRLSYKKHRQQFLSQGMIFHQFAKPDSNGRYKDEDRSEFINELGGWSFNGNWSSGDSFPMLESTELHPDGDEWLVKTPLTKDNRHFHYIGELTGFCYVEHGPDGVLLFYDPRDQIALITFDWG